jgi:hypothetical protein
MLYSFESWGIHNDKQLFYTTAVTEKSAKTASEFDEFKRLMDPLVKKPWIWIFDCKNMKAVDFTNVGFIYQMKAMIEANHSTSLKAIWILNINGWMRSTLALFGPVIVQILPTERLEMLVYLQHSGYAPSLTDALLRTIKH